MASHVLCVLLITLQTVYSDQIHRNEGIMDKISTGMKFATDYLGSESVAMKVAEFVVRAFQTGNNKAQTLNRKWPQNSVDNEESSHGESESFKQNKVPNYDINETQSPLTPLRHLVRLFGLQTNQISAVAVNALVFLAQLISSFIAGPKRKSEHYRSEDPMLWILNKNSKRLQDLITTAKNSSLPGAIDELIQEQGTEEEISCIRLLVCKITPFISRMQKTVFDNEEATSETFSKEFHGSKALYRHLPTAEEINSRSDICEQQYRYCNLNE